MRDLSNGSARYRLRGRQGKVIEGLGKAIVGGRYKPGSLLPREQELIDAFDVSRTSIREATKVLEAKGLVESRQRLGTLVQPRELWNLFDSDVLHWQVSTGSATGILEDLIEVRQVIEPLAARAAAARATLADLRRIEKAQQAMAESVTDSDRYAVSDVKFHMAVFAASHNSILQRFGHLVAEFLRQSFTLQQEARALAGADLVEDAEMHRVVHEAIKRGDSDAAAEAMLAAVLDGKSALAEAIEILGRAPPPRKRGF